MCHALVLNPSRTDPALLKKAVVCRSVTGSPGPVRPFPHQPVRITPFSVERWDCTGHSVRDASWHTGRGDAVLSLERFPPTGGERHHQQETGTVSALVVARSGHGPPRLEPGGAVPARSFLPLPCSARDRSRPCAVVRGSAVGVERHSDPMVGPGPGQGHAPTGPGIPWAAAGDPGAVPVGPPPRVRWKYHGRARHEPSLP